MERGSGVSDSRHPRVISQLIHATRGLYNVQCHFITGLLRLSGFRTGKNKQASQRELPVQLTSKNLLWRTWTDRHCALIGWNCREVMSHYIGPRSCRPAERLFYVTWYSITWVITNSPQDRLFARRERGTRKNELLYYSDQVFSHASQPKKSSYLKFAINWKGIFRPSRRPKLQNSWTVGRNSTVLVIGGDWKRTKLIHRRS